MPSPFPGMDPFLEHPDIFPDVHDSLVAYLREAIQLDLPAPYVAALGRRTWIEVSERYIGPDVQLSHPRAGLRPAPGHASTAVTAVGRTQPIVIRVPHDERSEPLVEIYTGRGSQRRLVTAIEVLSLTNKTPGEHGRDLYLRKQREILDGKVHLVEIDLLRGGQHTTAVPRQLLLQAAGGACYHVCIHHFDNLEDFFVYSFTLDQPLPEIAVPLLPGDPPVVVDLQAVFCRTYDAGPYKREVSYQQDAPVPPLSSQQLDWAYTLLGRQGASQVQSDG